MTRPNIGMDYAVLDCPDPAALANFYVQVLDWKSVRDEDDWHVIEGPAGERLAFQLAPDFVPVDWPTSSVGIHLDLLVDSLDPAEAWVISLGAQRVTGIPEHQTFRVYRDPVGHHFCLCLRD
ncbi:hypothetical protein O5Y_19720 [Rhodococcus erythropolis CCM2595]|uniref:VOC family protein n=1 Tax=Rhodococcus erythropolis TaxID=1833 RepID=UPI00038DC55A|nr:VOC family protein [Rhodococcus erythropolis]AGT93772.1 hypothetical protein O5Y_19720 [Rhodococcus erythropolis CCM2595]SUE11874.1 Predicted enzyme related to lactoylglutathione lyase [Rhodococcus erythropolis]